MHVLGGSGPVPASDESVEERQPKLLLVIMSRLKDEEPRTAGELRQQVGPNSIGTAHWPYATMVLVTMGIG